MKRSGIEELLVESSACDKGTPEKVLNGKDDYKMLRFHLLLSDVITAQAFHGLALKCKLINMHELINKPTNDYVTLLPCENGENVNNKG